MPLELVATTVQSACLAEDDALLIFRLGWPALDGLYGAGLLLVPRDARRGPDEGSGQRVLGSCVRLYYHGLRKAASTRQKMRARRAEVAAEDFQLTTHARGVS
jgi:hypothetical protein